MKKLVLLIIGVLITLDAYCGQRDSLNSTISLKEVEVIASNISRIEDHLLIIPTTKQLKHANNGYDVLTNIMLPGVNVNPHNGEVNVAGQTATIYINGVECDYRDVKMLRPRDIEKIEYFDVPTGKYAKDYVAINFVVKQYKYGGYVQAEASQTIGYSQGNYSVASSLNHKDMSYSLFAGGNHCDINDNYSYGTGVYKFADQDITRESKTQSAYKSHSEHLQFRFRKQSGQRYLIGRATFVNSNTPNSVTNGFVAYGKDVVYNRTYSCNHSLIPQLDFSCQLPIADNQRIRMYVFSKYSKNNGRRIYSEGNYESDSNQDENALNLCAKLSYDKYGQSYSFVGELLHVHNIWETTYKGSNPYWQQLWNGETQLFANYNKRIKGIHLLKTKIGVDWLQYSIHGGMYFSQLSPRVNLSWSSSFRQNMLTASLNFTNTNYGASVINEAEVEINPYLTRRGNPNIKKSFDILSYVQYSKSTKNVQLLTVLQHSYCHNRIIDDFCINGSGDKIVKTYNTGNLNLSQAYIGATYIISPSLSIMGNMSYSYAHLDALDQTVFDAFSGGAKIKWFIGNLSVTPQVSFSTKTMDYSSLAILENPLKYSLTLSYTYRDLYASIYVASPFNNRIYESIINTDVYDSVMKLDMAQSSQYCKLSVAYTFSFGFKTTTEKKEIDMNSNSSLLKI